MKKFIVVSLMLIIFSVNCFGLRCYLCKDRGDGNFGGPCPDGAETEDVECPVNIRYPATACYFNMDYAGLATTGPRLNLGCVSLGGNLASKEYPYCSMVYDGGLRRETLSCDCRTDLCNVYTENDFKCIVCTRGGGKDNLCARDETGVAKRCPWGMTYCHTTWTSNPGEDRKYYKGCARLPSAEDNKFTEENSASCRIEKTQKGVIEQECYCESNNCNRNSFTDLPIPDPTLWCYVCTQSGGRDNLCRSDEVGEKKRCPLGMKYCYSTWAEHPVSGLGRVYYKGCVKELPAEEKDKFEVQDSKYCRIRIPEKGKVTQECYCQSDNCNKNFDDLPIPEQTEEINKCRHSNGGDNTFTPLITVPVILLHILY